MFVLWWHGCVCSLWLGCVSLIRGCVVCCVLFGGRVRGMTKPIILDLFSGGGGAAVGYAKAGFRVVGVDIDPKPNYPFEFHQADALEFIARYGDKFDAIHGSPPCQGYSTATSSNSSPFTRTLGRDEPKLIAVTHEAMLKTGKPWVIENVMGARKEMPLHPTLLCGSFFNLMIPRHRLFSSSFKITEPNNHYCRGLAKESSEKLGWDYRDMSVTGKGRRAGTSDRWKMLLGIEHQMSQHELSESIPPVYTHYIGSELIKTF